jgi:hypothetical protein
MAFPRSSGRPLAGEHRQRDQLSVVLNSGADDPGPRYRERVAQAVVRREVSAAMDSLGEEALGPLVVRLGGLGVAGLQRVTARQRGCELCSSQDLAWASNCSSRETACPIR